MRVARWGNSLAVRLPRELAEKLSLREGDEIELRASGECSFEVVRDQRKAELIAKMRQLSVPLPADYRFDRDEANER